MRRVVLVCLFVVSLPATAHAVPGDIDPTFSHDGYTRIGFGDPDAEATALALDGQGRIVVAGTTGGVDSFGRQSPMAIAVARLLPSGDLDPSFSGDGRARFEVGAVPQVRDVSIDSAGRVLIGGSAAGNLLAMRLLPDGSPDASFDGDGVATADAGATETGGALLLGPSGSATVGGGTCDSNACRFAVARFDTAGAPDPSFGGDGIVVTAFPGDYSVINDLAAAPGGGFYAAGDNARQYHEAAIAKYTDSGALDPSYDGSGIAIVSDNTQGAIAIFPDSSGGIVGIGQFGALYRLTPEAGRDPSFAHGTALPRGALGIDDTRYYLGAGSIGGCYRGCSPQDTAVGRADVATGAIDRTFGGGFVNGWTEVDLDAKPDGALAVTADANHRPLTAGYSGNEMVVARLENADGPADRDGDGVIDQSDGCIFRFSDSHENGCPVNKRRITMHRRERADLWAGKITSPEDRCNFDQKVRVFKRRPGRDERTTSSISDGDGHWSADGNLRPGKYYARLEAYFKDRYGTCTEARSNVVTIHR